ncbi:CDP-diacylglycerol--glycerol-3-phosphate 3-phosphatidyltransferase, partial [Streptomyces sp. OspMP-M43]
AGPAAEAVAGAKDLRAAAEARDAAEAER